MHSQCTSGSSRDYLLQHLTPSYRLQSRNPDLTEETADYITHKTGYNFDPEQSFEIGGAIGVVTIVACARRHASPWNEPDCWAWVLADAAPLPCRTCRGAVGFFIPNSSSVLEGQRLANRASQLSGSDRVAMMEPKITVSPATPYRTKKGNPGRFRRR